MRARYIFTVLAFAALLPFGARGQVIGMPQATATVPGIATLPVASVTPLPFMRGVNLLGDNRFLDYNQGHATWPTLQGLTYWEQKFPTNGAYRVVTLWQNLQPTLGGPLNATNVAGLTATVNQITSTGAYAIIDMHQGGRYWYSDAEGGSSIHFGSFSGTVYTEQGGTGPIPGQTLFQSASQAPGGAVANSPITSGTRVVKQLTEASTGVYGANGTYQLDRSSTTSGNITLTAGPGRIIGETSFTDGLGQADPTAAQFAAFWATIAAPFAANSHVIFNIENEPNSQNTATLVTTLNTVIAAIRATGARNPILVDGNAYSGGSSWVNGGDPSGSNAAYMLYVVDSANNLLFDVHSYFDNAGGTSTTCVAGQGISALNDVTAWARANNKRLFMGEFGGANNAQCISEINDAVTFAEANSDVWRGWSAFGAYAGQTVYNANTPFFLALDDPTSVAYGGPAFNLSFPADDPRTTLLSSFDAPKVPFTPTSLGNTKLLTWLKQGTATASTWADSSGNGNGCVQSTVSNQPTVAADGGLSMTASQYMDCANIPTVSPTEVVIAVVKIPTCADTREVLQGTNSTGREMRVNSACSYVVNDQNVVEAGNGDTTVTPGISQVLVFHGASTFAATQYSMNGRLYLSGYGSGSFSGSGGSRIGPMGVGSDAAEIEEIVRLNGAVATPGDIARVYGYEVATHPDVDPSLPDGITSLPTVHLFEYSNGGVFNTPAQTVTGGVTIGTLAGQALSATDPRVGNDLNVTAPVCGAKIDGITNDLAAFNACLALMSPNQALLVPPGGIGLSATPTVPNGPVIFKLSGNTYGTSGVPISNLVTDNLIDGYLSGVKYFSMTHDGVNAPPTVRIDGAFQEYSSNVNPPGGTTSALQTNCSIGTPPSGTSYLTDYVWCNKTIVNDSHIGNAQDVALSTTMNRPATALTDGFGTRGPIWAGYWEANDQTNAASGLSGSVVGMEGDLFANGDDPSPGGRIDLHMVIGRSNASGLAARVSSGISIGSQDYTATNPSNFGRVIDIYHAAWDTAAIDTSRGGPLVTVLPTASAQGAPSASISLAAPSAGIAAGMVVTGSSAIPAGDTVSSVNLATGAVTLSSPTTSAIAAGTSLTFSSIAPALRVGSGQRLDLSGSGISELLYDGSNLQYQVSGTNVVTTGPTGTISTQGGLIVGGSNGAIAEAITGSSVVGLDFSAATISGAALRLAIGQKIAMEATGVYTFGLVSGVGFAFGVSGTNVLTVNGSGNMAASGSVTAASFTSGSSAGVSCSGVPSASFAATNGIVTHC